MNGAHSNENALQVIIIGGGISGLASAVALRQAGQNVTLYEKTGFEDESGAVVRFGPNTSGILKRWGITSHTTNSVQILQVADYSADGTQRHEKDASNLKDIYQHPWEYYDRIDLHKALYEKATSPSDTGRPVEVVTDSPIAHVNAENGIASLDNGEVVRGDTVLVADGVYSVIRENVFNVKAAQLRPGKVFTNFTVSVEDCQSHPIVLRFEKQPMRFETWTDEGGQIDVYMVHKGYLTFNCTYTSSESPLEESKDSIFQDVLKVFKNFAPNMLQLLQNADAAKIHTWPQSTVPSVENWTHGRLALVGDAAHPFLPYEAQGTAQALEDAAALGAVLPLGTTREEVQTRLQIYQQSRQERVNTIMNFTRDIGKDTTGSRIEKFQNNGAYTYGHDAHDWAAGKLQQHSMAYKLNINRMPTAFGIVPGLSRPLEEKPQNYMQPTFRTCSLAFETSRTYLENFLPTDAYSIISPGTIALASFYVTTFEHVEWLGGRGYSAFGLYIHNVQVKANITGSEAKTVTGRYVPLVFEDNADSVLSGREDSGVAKLFATLDITTTQSGYKLVAGWGGTRFAELVVEGLQQEDSSSLVTGVKPMRKSFASLPDEGIIHYKYIPPAEAAYSTVTPASTIQNTDLEAAVRQKYTAPVEKASITFFKEDKKKLPTLYNVVEGLRGIEIFNVVSVKLVDGVGVGNVN